MPPRGHLAGGLGSGSPSVRHYLFDERSRNVPLPHPGRKVLECIRRQSLKGSMVAAAPGYASPDSGATPLVTGMPGLWRASIRGAASGGVKVWIVRNVGQDGFDSQRLRGAVLDRALFRGSCDCSWTMQSARPIFCEDCSWAGLGGDLGRLFSDLFTNVTTGVGPMINSLLVLTGTPAGILLLSTLNMSAGVSATLRMPSTLTWLTTCLLISSFFVLYRSAGNSHRLCLAGTFSSSILIVVRTRLVERMGESGSTGRSVAERRSALAGSGDVTTDALDAPMTYLISTSAYASYSGGA